LSAYLLNRAAKRLCDFFMCSFHNEATFSQKRFCVNHEFLQRI
jgi:hypothetical protein